MYEVYIFCSEIPKLETEVVSNWDLQGVEMSNLALLVKYYFV